MNRDPSLSIAEWKQQLRTEGQRRRMAQLDRDVLSHQIVARLKRLPEYLAAGTVMFYVDVGSEVQTRGELGELLRTSKRVVVPYCVAGNLQLFHLEHFEELVAGAYHILEPRPDLRTDPAKDVNVQELDLIVAPGVSFDRRGGRIGVGKGYYDRLLRHTRPDALRVALAFDCQIFDDVPMEPHDVRMDRVITESEVHGSAG